MNMSQSASQFVILKPAFYAAGIFAHGELRTAILGFSTPFLHTEGVLRFK